MHVLIPSFCAPRCVAVAALALVAGCASVDAVVGLSIATTGSTAPEVGQTVTLVVRAIYDDGSSATVTELASCNLAGDAAIGTLAGDVFTAQAAGAVTVNCAYQAASASLALSVAGRRAVTVATIQRGAVALATSIEAEGVVFAIAPDAGFTDFWMQDPGGGPYSGIYVLDGRAAGAPPVAEGDVVRVRGVTGERNGRSVIELAEVTTTATAAPTVDTVPIAELAATRWDGCLVSVTDVVVTNPTVDAYTWEVAAVSQPEGAKLLIETLLFDLQPSAGQVFTRITGPLFPFVDDAGQPAVALVPRRQADLAGTAVAPTPYRLHDGSIAPGSEVTLATLIVTAIDYVDPATGQVDLYAQAPAGGAGAGVFLRDVRTAPTAAPTIGDLVTVTGRYDVIGARATIEYQDLQVTGRGQPVATPIDIAVDDLTRLESVLVVASTLRVSQAMVDAYSYLAQDDRAGGSATVRVDQSLYDPRPRVGDRYDALTGVVFRGTTYASVAPRFESDLELR